MGATNGIAGGLRRPEVNGIFLADDWEVEWFAEMAISAGHSAVDVWEVSLAVDATLIEDESRLLVPSGAHSAERDTSRESGWTPESRFE